MLAIGITDHLEGPRDRPSSAIFDEVADLVREADRLGVGYAWFAEHHNHAHQGHLPAPLLFALHLAGQTTQIRLGTAILCLNLHHPLAIAESVAVADVLTGGRMAVGFGSGSTPEEFALFGLAETDEAERHARFEEALRIIRSAWSGEGTTSSPHHFPIPPHRPLPVPSSDLPGRTWVAVNSPGSARIAGALGFNMLFSHLRTPAQYRDFTATYRSSGGAGLIAANRPVFVGPDDDTALALAEPALRLPLASVPRRGEDPHLDPRARRPLGPLCPPDQLPRRRPRRRPRPPRPLTTRPPFDASPMWKSAGPALRTTRSRESLRQRPRRSSRGSRAGGLEGPLTNRNGRADVTIFQPTSPRLWASPRRASRGQTRRGSPKLDPGHPKQESYGSREWFAFAFCPSAFGRGDKEQTIPGNRIILGIRFCSVEDLGSGMVVGPFEARPPGPPGRPG